MPELQRLNPETGSEAGCRLKARRKLVVEPCDTISDDEFHSSISDEFHSSASEDESLT